MMCLLYNRFVPFQNDKKNDKIPYPFLHLKPEKGTYFGRSLPV